MWISFRPVSKGRIHSLKPTKDYVPLKTTKDILELTFWHTYFPGQLFPDFDFWQGKNRQNQCFSHAEDEGGL